MPDETEVAFFEGSRYVVEVEGELVDAFLSPATTRLVIVPAGQASVFVFQDDSRMPARRVAPRFFRRGGSVASSWQEILGARAASYRFAYPNARGSVRVGGAE